MGMTPPFREQSNGLPVGATFCARHTIPRDFYTGNGYKRAIGADTCGKGHPYAPLVGSGIRSFPPRGSRQGRGGTIGLPIRVVRFYAPCERPIRP